MGQAEEWCGMDFPGLLQADLMKRLCITILFRSAEPYFFVQIGMFVVFQYIAVRRNISILRIGGITMQVTKLTGNQIGIAPKKHLYTEEEMHREYDYIRAEQMTKKLLDKGLITEEEFDKIAALNRKSFSPFLSEIMP